MLLRRKHTDATPRERALWGDLMGLGMVFPIAIALGFFIGRWAGGKLGHPKIGMGIGLVWGVATGFWELYKTTRRLDQYDEAERREREGKDHGA
ncbi:MAG TPA: AtpZ/AtpI family protein [Holophaga sp.]|nr:AtpZ/AtpI family protein [Holophaga sp.]